MNNVLPHNDWEVKFGRDPFADVLNFTGDDDAQIDKKYSCMTFIDKKSEPRDFKMNEQIECKRCGSQLCTIDMSDRFTYTVVDMSYTTEHVVYANKCVECKKKWYRINLPKCTKCKQVFMYDNNHMVQLCKCDQEMTLVPHFIEGDVIEKCKPLEHKQPERKDLVKNEKRKPCKWTLPCRVM